MAKRRHIAEDDDDEPVSQASSKRARTADSDNEPEDGATQTQTRPKRENDRKGKGKGKAKAEESEPESSDDDGDINAPEDDMDDEEFERVHGDKLRAHLERKPKAPGRIAEHGIIEYIEMHQFMCHKYLRFTFGPQINFIIGHNGSGKSAVLSAITVALGGKAASTGRGNGLKSFIREGQGASEVTIHIKNQGDEAYKPKEYGSTIVITRKFTKEGSSSWKIKSKDGRVISTKKDELAAICDHMNIQVDNPMNVLTQDSARQFLSASAPADKYKFFLRGTQLAQLSEEYEACLSNINQTAKLLSVKKEALPDLKARLREVRARYEEASKAREQKKKVDDLKKELAWSHVAAKEAEMVKAVQDAAKVARRVPKIEESIKKAQEDFDSATALVTELEAEHQNVEGMNLLISRKTELAATLRTNKTKISEYNTETKQMDASVKNIVAQVDELDKRIKEEARRMAAHTQAKHEETQRKLQEAKEQVQIPEREIHDLLIERKKLDVEAADLDRMRRDKDEALASTRRQIEMCENDITSAKKAETDALIPYGRNIKQVLERTKTMRWAGDPPLGPLGLHVKAKDPKKWGATLRNMLGQYLMAFALTDARDRPQLKKLLMETGNTHTIIIIFEKDLFDYRHGEPRENILTVLRALDISDPHVLRILINQAHIEGQVLADTRKEAEEILKSTRGGSAWSLDGFSVRVFPEGGSNSSPLNIRSMGGPMSLLLTGRDSAAEVRHITERKIQLENEYTSLMQECNTINQRLNHLRQNINRLTTQHRRLEEALRAAKVKLNNLQNEANEDLPVGVQGLEQAKQDALDEKENITKQFKHAVKEKALLDAQQKILQTELNEVKNLLANFEEQRNSIATKIADAVDVRMKAQIAKKHYGDKLKEEQKNLAEAEDAVKIVEEEFKNWTATATEYCEQVFNPRKTEDVQRNLDSVQKALKEREKRHGASVEEMAMELNKASENLEKASKELKQMTVLNKALKQSLIVRLQRWQEFRRHIALRCKHVFQFHLSNRGYYGKILFDHHQGTLQLRVQTDDQQQTQGTREKDPRSLSGGEKSFSTICLLLSLWECIGCPLRCLDEFDVFMDAVNRRISMKMMIDTANMSDRKQYILITPQDMTNVTVSNSVKVHRMTDPERGNSTLPFGSG
ncbi:P-loop containing nucleoside triphosphate hydrolase protein [Pholiota conissans]|uniref:P-loop containing nucleoside triphosphate hydrolase protein n=1 Tax=Pholiota conissans TaxID=109636 RepID=A0A9P5ZBQ5_9AGAR|nr:P-loop containing nucleoside triphosphate hydrolase protein [Pholiota conissans]